MFHANIFMLPMFERIKRIFSGLNRSAPSPAALLSKASVDNSVPQFPPFPRGFPVIDPADVLKTQSELLVSIRDMLGFSLDEHARIVEPILLRFASYAHLLPASQIHHHRGAGGLLRHGLEVAFWAGQASKAVVFPFDGAPRFKHEHRARWRLAYFLAGLTHDVGKPVTDMQITDASGQHIWEPYGPSLMQWSVANGIDRYYIRWVASRRHKQHESGGLLIANRILGEGEDVFSGLIWNGEQALEMGLIDGLESAESVARTIIGQDSLVNYTPNADVFSRLASRVMFSAVNLLESLSY